MPDLYALTEFPLPGSLLGTDGAISIRRLSDWERRSIEDLLVAQNPKVALADQTTAVIVPQSQAGIGMHEFAVMVEFALGVATIDGFQPISIVASFNNSRCGAVILRQSAASPKMPTYPAKLKGTAFSQWTHHVFDARKKLNSSLHITADRFVRFLKSDDPRDSLVDLCICLESLIESQTEISFRFSVCLAKASGLQKPLETGELLLDLYNFRSKVVHGSDSTKEHRKIQPNLPRLRSTSRAILSSYILYLAKHTKAEWKQHLRSSLFS
jgi:hypothetical protein